VTLRLPFGQKLGLCILGGLSGLPIVVGGIVSPAPVKIVVIVAGVALSTISMVRTARIELSVQDDIVTVRNRWRTITIPITAVRDVVPVVPWWLVAIRASTVDALGIETASGKRISAQVTIGMRRDALPIEAVLDALNLR
jgi:hypothetical protein